MLSGLWGALQALADIIWSMALSSLWWVITLLTGVIEGVWEALGPTLVGLGQFALSLLPPEWFTILNGRPWADIVALFDAVDWFTGIYASMGILATAYTSQAAIRFTRWVLAFIPTLNL